MNWNKIKPHVWTRRELYIDRNREMSIERRAETRVCSVCKKAGDIPLQCCGKWTYSLGWILRAPRVNAGRGKWKKFWNLVFNLPINKNIVVANHKEKS